MMNKPGIWLLCLIGLGCQEEADFVQGDAVVRAKSDDSRVLVEKTFAAGRLADQTLNLDAADHSLTQTVRIGAQTSRAQTFEQIDRPVRVETFVQGNSGTFLTQNFDLKELGMLDLLLVIDDSSSMFPYQQELAARLPMLLDRIGNTNWQIAVTTTSGIEKDNNSGCLRRSADGLRRTIDRTYFEADPVGANTDFAYMVEAGAAGNPVERGVSNMLSALAGDCGDPNNPWIREGSNIAILILSDEENCGSSNHGEASDEGIGSGPNQCRPIESGADLTAFDALAAQYQAEQRGFQVHGFLYERSICEDWGPEHRDPLMYRSMIASTSGNEASVCSSSQQYSDHMSAISASIGLQFKANYPLLQKPDMASVKITIDGSDITSYFNVTGKVLKVRPGVDIPDSNEPMIVSYYFDPVPVVDRWALEKAPDPKTTSVMVNGMPVEPKEWAADSKNGTIIFKKTPSENSKIQVQYQENKPLKQTFEIENLHQVNSVFVNGNKAEKWHGIGNKIAFDEAPKDGAKIEVVFYHEEDINFSYPLPFPPDTPLAEITAIRERDGEPIEVTVDADQMHFNPKDIYAGHDIAVSIVLDSIDDPISINMPTNILEETIAVQMDNEACRDGMEITADGLYFSCSPEEIGNAQVTYKVVEDATDRFPIDGPDRNNDSWVWMVFVDGVPTDNFTVEGKAVRVPKDIMKPDSEVRVRVVPIEVLEEMGPKKAAVQ